MAKKYYFWYWNNFLGIFLGDFFYIKYFNLFFLENLRTFVVKLGSTFLFYI